MNVDSEVLMAGPVLSRAPRRLARQSSYILEAQESRSLWRSPGPEQKCVENEENEKETVQKPIKMTSLAS